MLQRILMYLLYVNQLNLDHEGKSEKKRKNETCPWLLQAGFHPPGGPGPAPALIGLTIAQLEIRVILHTILRLESRRTQIWHEKQKVYNLCNDDIHTSSSIKSFLRMTSRLLTPLRPSFRKSEYIFFSFVNFFTTMYFNRLFIFIFHFHLVGRHKVHGLKKYRTQ